MTAWIRLHNATSATSDALLRLIGRTRTRPNSTRSGNERSQANSPEPEIGPRMPDAVELVLETVTLGDMAQLPTDVSSRAMVAFLRLIRNPYALTSEADARFILFAVRLAEQDVDAVD